MEKTRSSIGSDFLVLSFLFLIAPFYIHPNVGGLGLAVPFNIAIWLMAILFICLILIQSINTSIQRKTINSNQAFLYCLLFPIIIVFSGIFTEVPEADVWLFRQLYILGGFIFLFALLQTDFTAKKIEQILYCLVIATLLHALVGVAEIANLTALKNWLPLSQDSLPIGVFQQVNVQASFLTTGLVIILYLISRPSFISARFISKVLFIVTFGLAVYVIVSTGSRVGLLSLIMACGLMIFSRQKQLVRHKKFLILLTAVALVAALAGQSGFFRALDKTQQMTDGEYASARQTMYAVALNLIENKPVLGYGIGSFPRVWVEQKTKFAASHPDAVISQVTTSHPHNEVLLWFIEGGLVAILGLVIILIVVIRALYRCGFSRGGAYAALLLPITLHTQVELPFYISSLHWFLWLFLIFIVFRHQIKTVSISLSRSALYFSQFAVMLLGLTGGYLLIHAEKAEKEIYNYMYGDNANLQVALDDLYFNSFAEKLMMQSLLYRSINQNNKSQIPMFIRWAEDTIQYNPELGMFVMLSDAYGFNDDKTNQCRVARQGLGAYTKNERLQATVSSCQ